MYLGTSKRVLPSFAPNIIGVLASFRGACVPDRSYFRPGPNYLIPTQQKTRPSSSLSSSPASKMERVNTTDRLAKLRELMRSQKVDVYGG
jgi:hypothetical protein